MIEDDFLPSLIDFLQALQEIKIKRMLGSITKLESKISEIDKQISKIINNPNVFLLKKFGKYTGLAIIGAIIAIHVVFRVRMTVRITLKVT